MPYEIWQNESDAVARRIPIYLENTDGTPFTGSLTGFTITYRKPGASSDTNVSLTAVGAGRYYYAASSGDVDTKGAAWMTVTMTGTILPWVDAVTIKPEEPSIATILADVVSALSTLSTLSANETSMLSSLTSILARLPSSLDGSGNIKAAVQSIVNNAVTSSAIAANAFQTAAFADAFLTTAKLADNLLTSAKLTDGLFTAAKFASGAFNAVGPVVATAIMYGTRTLRGVMKRMDRMLIGHATGLLSGTATFYDEDGTTKVAEFAQDTGAGTRSTATTPIPGSGE